jgi:hypothetical protein
MLASMALVLAGPVACGEDKIPAPAPLGSIQVQLPEGELRLSFVESAEGMALLLHAGDSHVRGRRLWLGDGKIAVSYEATSGGVNSQGRRLPNAAAFDFDHRTVIEVQPDHMHEWGQQAGETYVKLQGVRFKVMPATPK